MIVLSQDKYTKNLDFVAKESVSNLETWKKIAKTRIGQLNWLAGQIRPDLAFCVNNLNSVSGEFSSENLSCLNKVIKHAKCQFLPIKFPSDLNFNDIRVICFSDASFGNVKNGGSQGGYIIFVADKWGKCAPVSWSSKRVVKSTLAVETLALKVWTQLYSSDSYYLRF